MEKGSIMNVMLIIWIEREGLNCFYILFCNILKMWIRGVFWYLDKNCCGKMIVMKLGVG